MAGNVPVSRTRRGLCFASTQSPQLLKSHIAEQLEIVPIPPSDVAETQDNYPENQHIVISQIEKELNEVARRSTKSVLRQRDYEGLSSLDFAEITEEMKVLCPTTFNIVSAMIQFVNNEEDSTYGTNLQYHDV
ncbi:uncharacterized protein LOC141897562 [Acropora palmata]|uniref:uncharacterized protein LOC141897562 n=1 Tax=Acropora palmata TaxID=6131 RepID=UPI003DA1A40D